MKDSMTFCVDHTKLTKGVYLCNTLDLGDSKVHTIDLRFRTPYKEEVISNEQLHTFEHCFATAIRDVLDDKKDVIRPVYIGPMGCSTGFYVVLAFVGDAKDISRDEIFEYVWYTFMKATRFIDKMEETPAMSEQECGNCRTLLPLRELELNNELKRLLVYKEHFDSYVMLDK